MFEQMRFTAGGQNSPLEGLIMRSLEQGTGDLSVTGLRTPGFRALAPLMERAQVVVDKAVVEVGLQRLSFVADLLSEGLTYNLPDPLSVPYLEWNTMSKQGAAQRTMSPHARGESQLPIMLPYRTPIFLTTDKFEIDIRTLKMSQRVGMPLDTAMIGQCTRSVNEAIEDQAINGATTLDGQAFTVGGYGAPGLLNATNANTFNITDAAWVTAPVGTTILAEVMAMVAILQADKKFGPYNLYVGTVIGNNLEGDFSTTKGELSIRQRLEQIVAGGRNLRIRTTDAMPAGTVALVQMTSDVVQVINGQPPTVVPWTSLDGFVIHNLVMAIMIARFRFDADGNSGIVIGT